MERFWSMTSESSYRCHWHHWPHHHCQLVIIGHQQPIFFVFVFKDDLCTICRYTDLCKNEFKLTIDSKYNSLWSTSWCLPPRSFAFYLKELLRWELGRGIGTKIGTKTSKCESQPWLPSYLNYLFLELFHPVELLVKPAKKKLPSIGIPMVFNWAMAIEKYCTFPSVQSW